MSVATRCLSCVLRAVCVIYYTAVCSMFTSYYTQLCSERCSTLSKRGAQTSYSHTHTHTHTTDSLRRAARRGYLPTSSTGQRPAGFLTYPHEPILTLLTYPHLSSPISALTYAHLCSPMLT